MTKQVAKIAPLFLLLCKCAFELALSNVKHWLVTLNTHYSMKKIVYVMCALCFCSCRMTDENVVERMPVDVKIIANDLMTSMPCEMLVYDSVLVWYDLTPESFIHVVDKQSGLPKADMGKLGGGPNEFSAPYISWYPDNRILSSDCFEKKHVTYSVDRLSADSVLSFNRVGPLVGVGQHQFLSIDFGRDFPFQLIADDKVKQEFGKYPIDKSESISNKFEVFQGIVAYNRDNKHLLYSVPSLSYIALYKWEEFQFNLVWEKQLPGLEYRIDGTALIIDKTMNYAPSAIALTKDYIVTVERDQDTQEVSFGNPSDSPAKRRFTKTPQTLFVYDYNYKLKKILHTKLPVFRIASDGLSNEIFFIAAHPDFCIAKCIIE